MNLTSLTLSMLLIGPMPDQTPIVLPEGFGVRCAAYTAELVSPDPLRRSIYLQLTASGIRSPGSPYFWRHFPRVIGPGWTMWLQQVRCAAMRSRGAALTHDQLAQLIGCKADSLRVALRWLNGETDAKTPFRIPGDEDYTRAVLRTYVPRIAPDPYYHGSGRAPYRYWALPAEVIYRDHLEAFATIEQGARVGQRVFSFPELWGFGVDGDPVFSLDPLNPDTEGGSTQTPGGSNPDVEGGSDSEPRRGGGFNPDTEGGSTRTPRGVRPPHTPPCMHAAAKSMHADRAEATSGETAPAKTGSSLDVATAVAAARHAPLELPGEVTRTLDALPNGATWRARWQVWIHFTDAANPIGLVIHATKQACAGAEGYQAPPARLQALVDEERARGRRAAGEPDAGTIVKKRQKVRPETSVLPELEQLWEHVRHHAPAMSRASLDASTAVLLDGNTLVIELPSTTADLIRKHRGALVDLARAIRPEIGDLRFQPTKGGR